MGATEISPQDNPALNLWIMTDYSKSVGTTEIATLTLAMTTQGYSGEVRYASEVAYAVKFLVSLKVKFYFRKIKDGF